MGTNFYWRDTEEHIGKRSAAGQFCWDCDETLCIGGRSGVHYSKHGWYQACPRCGGLPVREDPWSEGSGALELGFAVPRKHRPTGVRSCSSFTWASDSLSVRIRCAEEPESEIVIDEYGRAMKGCEFLAMLGNNCPIEYFDSIGTEFS